MMKNYGHGFDIALAVIFLYKADSAAALVRGMVEPFAAAYRDAVIAGKPFFAPGFDEFFTLPEEKIFEVDGRGVFFLF